MSNIQKIYEELFFDFWKGSIDRKAFLDFLYNQFGNFQVQMHTKDGFISKRRDWLDARENPFFMNDVNHRTPCSCEIIFDIDLPDWLTIEERTQILNMTLRRLSERKIYPLSLYTGKGFHLHWFDDELNRLITLMSGKLTLSSIRDNYIRKIIADVRTDMMMVRGNNTIQLEGVKHWKRDFIVTPCSEFLKQ